MLVCGSFTHGKTTTFDSSFARFRFNGALNFPLKNLLRGNGFLTNFRSFYIDIVFSGQKKIII